MLDGIFQVLTDIGNFFSSVADFVVRIFEDLLNFTKAIAQAVSFIPTLADWLPGIISAVILTCLTLAIIFRVVGRE